MKDATFWICAALFLAFTGHWIVHKFRQLKFRIKDIEQEMFFYIQVYGKQRQEKREKEARKKTNKKGR